MGIAILFGLFKILNPHLFLLKRGWEKNILWYRIIETLWILDIFIGKRSFKCNNRKILIPICCHCYWRGGYKYWHPPFLIFLCYWRGVSKYYGREILTQPYFSILNGEMVKNVKAAIYCPLPPLICFLFAILERHINYIGCEMLPPTLPFFYFLFYILWPKDIPSLIIFSTPFLITCTSFACRYECTLFISFINSFLIALLV